MKSRYRGFELEVKREKCLAGYPLLYYSVFQEGREWDSGFEDSEEKVTNKIQHLKNWVDNFYISIDKKECPICGDGLIQIRTKYWQ
jgi:hypothetical protein